MKTKIDPAMLRRLETLRAPYKARLQVIKALLESEPRNFGLILEAETIRLKFYEIMRQCEGEPA